MPAVPRRFEPTDYSLPELRFLLTHLEDPPVVIRDLPEMPSGVVRVQVLKVISDCYELAELERHKSLPWAGYAAVKDSINRTLGWYQTCEALRARGGPAHPSLHAWDGNRYIPHGIDSDSQQVKTEILADGSRRALGLDLRLPEGHVQAGPNLVGAAPWLTPEGGGADLMDTTPSDFVQHENPATRTGNLICPICEKSENYDLALSNSKHRARVNLMRHCKQIRTQKQAHAILLSRVSGRSIAAA